MLRKPALSQAAEVFSRRGFWKQAAIIGCLAAFLLVAGGASESSSASPREWVFPSDACPWNQGLQACINKASSGDIVKVESGRTENLTINKPLQLIGEGWTDGTIRGSLTILSIQDRGPVVVRGLTFEDDKGVVIFDSQQVTLEANLITDHEGQGVLIEGNSQVVLKANGILDNKGDGVVAVNSQVEFIGTAEGFPEVALIRGNSGCGIRVQAGGTVTGGGIRIFDNGGGDLCPAEGFPSGFVRQERELRVPRDVSDLTQAIENAWPGETLLLAPGTYEGNWWLFRPLTLQGEDPERVVLKNKEAEPVLRIGGSIRLESMTLSTAQKLPEVIWDDCLESGYPFNSCSAAIVIAEAEEVVIKDILIHGSQNVDAGIAIVAAEATLESVTISGSFSAVGIGRGGQVSLKNSRLVDNEGLGVFARVHGPLTFEGNLVQDNGSHGIYFCCIGDTDEVTLEGNTIQGNHNCGILGFGEAIKGQNNTMGGNGGGDLCGEVPAALRVPLVEQGTKTPLTVCPSGCDFANLQEAVDALPPNGEIALQPGTHLAGVTIWKPLTLRGTSRLQVTLRGALSIIRDAQEVQIKGLTLTDALGRGPFPWPSEALEAFGLQNLTVRDVEVTANEEIGILVDSVQQVTIADSTIARNGDNGISLFNNKKVEIENVRVFRNNDDGLGVWNYGDNDGDNEVTIRSSEFKENGDDGIYLYGGQYRIIDNTISFNQGYGINHDEGEIVECRDNRVFNNAKGNFRGDAAAKCR